MPLARRAGGGRNGVGGLCWLREPLPNSEGMDKLTFSVPGNSDDDGKKGPRLPAVCAVCGEEAAKKCPCKLVMYCSKECQKRDWKAGHKDVCLCRPSAKGEKAA